MNWNNIISLTFAVVAVVASPSFAIEVRTYQFSGDDRPFAYQAWGPAIDAQILGTFDLVLDQSAGTGQLTNLQARIANPAYAPPDQDSPLLASTRTYFDNVPLSTRWPTNLGSLTGHFIAADLLEFDGPNSGVYFRQTPGSDRPYLGYTYGSAYIEGFDTALQLKLGGDSVTINAVATQILWNDAPLYYLLNAHATLVPEPGIGAMLWMLSSACFTRRRNLASYNRV
jgi:hypothetical protein